MSSQAPMSMPYPVYAAAYPPGYSANSESALNMSTKMVDDPRDITRTPSPTLSEYNALNGIKEQKTTKQKIRTSVPPFAFQRWSKETSEYYAIIAVILVAVILFSIFHTQIITVLQPFTNWLADNKIGPFLIIAMLIILSFPPLFGHELIAMLAGIAWSLPEAFLIVAIGTLLGETANFVTFKYACSVRGAKMEAKDISYGLLAHVVRNGGFLVILVIRFSAIPPHFATAVFSTVGVSFMIFIAAAVLSLPKQLASVYVGYALKPSNANDTTSQKVEKIVLVVSIIITIAAFAWIRRQMDAAKEEHIYLRRKARQGKAAASSNGPHFIGMPAVV
ncbi:hypothetical protein DFH07DRAFT_985847 [Mycena maculata]|uniref:Golgi apparatus membrane protein TVP38 n=1 Tax=Mycena maculata TaxID=230809 RepID=A0AAD7I7C5_9AGAR|nr:hypothetical protein DFH07DRAFT_985847 [Mycena maculata]